MRLIHPIYLDIPMLVSFAAAIEGGVSFGTEVTREESNSSTTVLDGGMKFGLSRLFSQFFDASASLQMQDQHDGIERSVEHTSRAHTESSVAILLYDRLRKNSGYIVDLETLDAAREVEPGALVEIAGTVEKNAVDAMIDGIDAVNILSRLAVEEQPDHHGSSTGRRRNGSARSKGKVSHDGPLVTIRDSLDRDRKRTPISNVLLRCSTPKEVTAVVTLRTENLRDLTLSELHKNSVRVLGKVTRVIGEKESMSPFENYGMALLHPDTLQEVFQELRNNDAIAFELSEVQVQGPALQVLPLMVFV